jgi:hypothetical protein
MESVEGWKAGINGYLVEVQNDTGGAIVENYQKILNQKLQEYM